MVIIGAGPAGLTAAYELACAGVTDVVVLEADSEVGGLARSVNYKGNRIDIGGHRFFSKSDWVMDWWLRALPLAAEPAAAAAAQPLTITYHGKSRPVSEIATARQSDERVMLVRKRLDRKSTRLNSSHRL